MHFSGINVWAVLVATVIRMAIGSLWYSPVLFSKLWMKLIKLNQEEMRSPAGPMFGVLIMSLISSFVLAILIQWTGNGTALSGLAVAALLSVIVSAAMATNYLFEGRGIQLFLINAGYHVAALLVSGILLGIWH